MYMYICTCMPMQDCHQVSCILCSLLFSVTYAMTNWYWFHASWIPRVWFWCFNGKKNNLWIPHGNPGWIPLSQNEVLLGMLSDNYRSQALFLTQLTITSSPQLLHAFTQLVNRVGHSVLRYICSGGKLYCESSQTEPIEMMKTRSCTVYNTLWPHKPL